MMVVTVVVEHLLQLLHQVVVLSLFGQVLHLMTGIDLVHMVQLTSTTLMMEAQTLKAFQVSGASMVEYL